MKRNFKSNRKAFTLIELLIVIAIIGILFVVLVSKVDFATDKAKTTGVQTDFRSFQVAFETVSRENSGFNTLGWDTGDNAGGIAKDGPVTIGGVEYTYANADKDAGDRKRNSYDVGDLNLNGKCDADETFTGRKIYTETWTGIYTLDNPGDADDKSAYIALEQAINKNLDPKLHVTINPVDKTFNMKNGYQDPWKTEYHGFYLSNAAVDGKDRGAIVMYSDGPNKVFGSEQTIANGIVTVTVKNGAVQGQDDLSLVTCYTYTNGYGEIGTTTFGFSNNQQLQAGGGNGGPVVIRGEGGYQMLNFPAEPITVVNDIEIRSEAEIELFQGVKVNGEVVDPSNYTVTEGSTIVTLKSEYIASLEDGEYVFEIVSDNGTAKCNILINLKCEHEWDEDGSGICTICGETHIHDWSNCSYEYEYWNNGNHDIIKICLCGQTSYSHEEECVFGDDKKCDLCNYEYIDCIHYFYYCSCTKCGTMCPCDKIAETMYWSSGNGTHTGDGYCLICYDSASYSVYDEPCTYENGRCKYCGYEEPAGCEHEWSTGMCLLCGEYHHNIEEGTPRNDYYTNSDGTHLWEVYCSVCNAPMEVGQMFDCTYENGKCKYCGYEEPDPAECEHEWSSGMCVLCDVYHHDIEYGVPRNDYYTNSDGTHLWELYCSVCDGPMMAGEMQDCTYENGKCKYCGYEC